MKRCEETLGTLVCTREEGHEYGHVYHANWAADGHDRSEPKGHGDQ